MLMPSANVPHNNEVGDGGIGSFGQDEAGASQSNPPFERNRIRPECYTAAQMRRVIEKERERADRSCSEFCLCVFRPLIASPRQLALLGRILLDRARLTDDVGMLDDDRVSVLLHETAVDRAHPFVMAIRDKGQSKGTGPLDVRLYVYSARTRQLSEAFNDSCKRIGKDNQYDGLSECGNSSEESMSPNINCLRSALVEKTPRWKRIVDIFGAAVGLIMASPLIISAMLAIRITSPGPVIFKQPRAGLGGKPFTCYKLRTMVVDAEVRKAALRDLSEQDGPAFKLKNDPRITWIGRLLRKTSIDELPQLWNVLLGDMSLVGPRPPTLDEVAHYEQWQHGRLNVVPGITCIWQVEGRSRVSFQEWMRMDRRYIRRRSFRRDLTLLLRTIPAVLFQRGAR